MDLGERRRTLMKEFVHDYSKDYLTFKALEDGTFTLTVPANVTDAYVTSISYSVDNGETWTTITNDSTLITITTPTILAGHKVLWKGIALALSLTTTSGKGTCCNFSSTHKFNVSGNIMSLLKDSDFAQDSVLSNTKQYNFNSLFCDCTKLISVSNLILPSKTALNGTYRWMFARCTSLTDCAIMLADTFNFKSCHSMYYGCTSLVNAPEILPAMTLGTQCYTEMFQNCNKLTRAPKLPATTLTTQCYQRLFQNCTSLTTAPELPATTLAYLCYYQMFQGCTSLTTAPELPATTLKSRCYDGMFYGCTSLTTAPELPSTTLVSGCYKEMFYGCSNLNYIKAMFTTTPSASYTSNWVNGVKSTGTFVKNSAAEWDVTDTYGVPTGWSVETASS